MEQNKVGLVLEGGGMRGMYTAGVLDVFLQKDILVQGLVGVSAGCIHGCNYLSKQVGRSVRYNLKYIGDKRYMSFSSLRKTGDLFNVDFCYDEIPNRLNKFDYETFRRRAKEIAFYVTCTNLETGMAEHIRCMDLEQDMDYMRASASLPLVSRTVEAGGMKLLDGGSSDSIPLRFFQSIGFEKNIVVLTRPEGYIKKPDKSISLIARKYKDYPDYVETCRRRHEDYNESLSYLEACEKAGNTLVLRPSRTVKIGRLEKDKEKLKYMYKLGRYDAGKKLDEIKAFLR